MRGLELSYRCPPRTKTHIRKWWNNLLPNEQREFAHLDCPEMMASQSRQPVCEDWIEEHGGQRHWWGFIVGWWFIDLEDKHDG